MANWPGDETHPPWVSWRNEKALKKHGSARPLSRRWCGETREKGSERERDRDRDREGGRKVCALTESFKGRLAGREEGRGREEEVSQGGKERERERREWEATVRIFAKVPT